MVGRKEWWVDGVVGGLCGVWMEWWVDKSGGWMDVDRTFVLSKTICYAGFIFWGTGVEVSTSKTPASTPKF